LRAGGRRVRPTGSPRRAHSRCSRSPRNQREWEAQYPYQVPQVRARVADPAGLGGEAEQGLQHGQGDQPGVTELRCDAHGRPQRRDLRGFLQQVVGSRLQCGSEGV
jgi:hypothetical protein